MRRPNGFGTVTKMGGNRRNPYAVRIPVRDHRGRVQQKYLSYHHTQAEAWAALEAYRLQSSAGTAPAPDDLGVTLQEVYAAWSARKFAKTSKSTILSFKSTWGHFTHLANTPIRKIGIDQWQAVIDAAERAQASQTRLNKDASLMKQLSRFALERDWITKDYAQFIVLPTVGAKYEKGAFTELEVKKLEQFVATGVRGADAALVLCYTGFRINEFLALTRFSYDAQEHTLTGGSKTDAGRNRVIPIHPKIQPIIDRWIAQGGDRLYTLNGKPVSDHYYRVHVFAKLAEDLGRPAATPHWCRHTFASMLHAAGADELNVKRLMGHSDKDVTDHYTHVTLQELRNTILLIA